MAYGCFSPGFDTPHPGLRGRRLNFASMGGELTRGRIARSKIFFPPVEKIRTKYSCIRWRQNRQHAPPGVLVGGATRMSRRHNPGSRRRQSPALVFLFIREGDGSNAEIRKRRNGTRRGKPQPRGNHEVRDYLRGNLGRALYTITIKIELPFNLFI